MERLDDIINYLGELNEIKDEIEILSDKITEEYNGMIDGILDIEDDIEREIRLSQPLFQVDNYFFRLIIAIERNTRICIKTYINSDDFKNDRLYQKNIKTEEQFVAYICYLLSDDSNFARLRYDYYMVNFYQDIQHQFT